MNLHRAVWPTLCLALIGCEKAPKLSTIEPLPVPAWESPYPAEFLIKSVKDGTGDVLLMNLDGSSVRALREFGEIKARNLVDFRPIYRLSISERRLYQIAPETWDENTSTATDCGMQRSLLYPGQFRHDLPERVLRFQQKLVIAAGKTVLTTAVSPDGQYANCLSADGSLKKGLMPFSAPTISGKRFHQIFRMSDATPVGDPLVLAKTSNKEDIVGCWSPDGRCIVYINVNCKGLWVIEVPILPSEERK